MLHIEREKICEVWKNPKKYLKNILGDNTFILI